MSRLLVFLLLLLLYSTHSYSQKGYFANDTLRSVGFDIIDGGRILNSEICQVKTGDKIIKYSPYEIVEYGINEDQIYVAKNIIINDTLKRVFLEVLLKGKTSLFYYQNENYSTFFISKDSITLIEVPGKVNNKKQNYKSVLREITSDCKEVSDAINLVKYNRKPVTELINRYNDCENKPFPFTKFGILGGYEFSKLANPPGAFPSFLEYIDYQFNGFFFFGVFTDIPILPSNLSVHTELYHTSHKFSETGTKNNEYYNLTANQNAIKMPVLLRYSFNKRRTIPYFNAGGIFAYNYNHQNNIYLSSVKNDIIEVEVLDGISVISDFQYGVSAGFGIERKINNRNALFFELRFNKLFKQSKNTLANNELQIVTGINF